ncbi:MAG: phosphate regulon transcriptional regulator PhoB [Gammaproteobacteria bacterium]|nr:phosphate regulon transcriptional regulator PhoB [Gammaproteobacteria bacterium]
MQQATSLTGPNINADVLIVDDEPAIRDMLAFALQRAGMTARTAEDAEHALHAIADKRPDILLLDWMMPGISGLDLARRLRREDFTRDLPIIMLTARTAEDDRVHGLDSGADDYIIKPFSPRELIARVKALLRRTSHTDAEGRITAGDIILDSESHMVKVKGQTVSMGPTEYRLLEFFMSHSGKAYNRTQLLDNVWGANVYVEERTVDVHIRRLRKALGQHGVAQYIQTIRGHGYRFTPDDSGS